jgi:hypothetical protein
MVALAVQEMLGLLEASMLKYQLQLYSYQGVAVIMMTLSVLAYLLCKSQFRRLLCVLKKMKIRRHDQLPDN